MKYIDILKDSFVEAISNSEIKFSDKNRKLSELDYFEAYLIFIDNSIHYSRFSITIKDFHIKGKYLNEKVNKWANYGKIRICIQ